MSPERLKNVVKGYTETGDFYHTVHHCPRHHKIYQGFVSEQRFNINRINHYLEFRSAEIMGEIKPENGQTIIRLSITMNFLWLVATIILIISTFTALIWAINGVLTKVVSYQGLIIPIFIGIILLGFWSTFRREAAFEKEFFEKCLNVSEEENCDKDSSNS